MQPIVIAARLTDLPTAFMRQDPVYYAWQTSQETSLTEYCVPGDALPQQVTFTNAVAGWLDVWGQLLGFQRNSEEGDVPYSIRIKNALIAPVGTPIAIELFGTQYLNAPVSVVEGFATYAIGLPAYLSTAQTALFLAALARVRPAGVPFTTTQSQEGVFYDTMFFFGSPWDAGVYAGGQMTPVSLPLSQTTNNSQPLLPSLMLTDPILNGVVTL